MNKPTLALLALPLLACGPAPEPVAPAPAPPPPATVTAATPLPPPEPTSAPAPPPKPAAPFSVVVELPGPFWFFPVEGALLVAAGQTDGEQLGAYYPGEDLTKPDYRGDRVGRPIGVLEGGKVRFPRKLFFPSSLKRVVAIEGRWPDGVRMLATGTTGRTGIAEQYVLTDHGWTEKGPGVVGSFFAGMARSGGALFGLRAPVTPWTGAWAEIEVLEGRASTPRITPATRAECPSYHGNTVSRNHAIAPAVFGGTRDGTLFSVGFDCKERLSAETWKPGAHVSAIQVLDQQPFKREDLGDDAYAVRGAGNESWVLGAFVAHFDGAAWKLRELPAGVSNLVGGAVAPDGALWAIGKDEQVWKLAGDAWEEVALPDGVKADDIAVYDGALYVSAGGALLRHGPPGAPPSPRPQRAPGGDKPVLHLPTAGSARCPNNLVVLYAFTKVTPDDYDFPLTRKALKGHFEVAGARYFVTKDLGQKFLAAQVPTFEAGQRLAALIEKSLQGAKPQIVCAAPEVVREVKVDLGTGEIVK